MDWGEIDQYEHGVDAIVSTEINIKKVSYDTSPLVSSDIFLTHKCKERDRQALPTAKLSHF